jgi:phage terminase large subunit
MFVRTTAISKLLNMKARKKVVQNGTSAGKTYGIIPVIIDWAAKNPKSVITVVAESIHSVRNGAVKIFKDIMQDTGRWDDIRWRSNPMEYTYANGTIIQFTSFDKVGKAKAAGKRDILFLNEANHISYEIADALMVRSKQTWIDYNPDNEFWAHTETLRESDSEFLLLTYLDNEGLPEETYAELMIKLSKAFHDPNGNRNDPNNIKSTYWANWCRVYLDGEIDVLQGAIFSNWSIGEFDVSLPFVYGLDFGFSNDPDSMVKIAIDKKRMRIYLDEKFYKTGNSTGQLITLLKANVEGKATIVADSADPRTITDLRQTGLNVIPARKGHDSIRSGIKRMQDYEIIVTETSFNTLNELRRYVWHEKKAEIPIDAWNHQIDPARYGFEFLNPASTLAMSKD